MLNTSEILLKYTAAIWKIYISEDKFLMLEIRDESTMTTSFDLFDIQQQKYQWRDQTFEEDWRVGISYLTNQIFVVHVFGSGNLPNIEKLLVFSTVNSEQINTLDNIQPQFFDSSTVTGTDNEGNIKSFDLLTGEEKAGKQKFSSEDVMNKANLPLTYTEDSDNFVTVKNFVSKYLQEEATGMAEYLEYKENIFLSYHVKGKLLDCYLLGISKSGDVWLNEHIDKSDKYISDTFFIWQDYLIFIKGKNVLKAIKI